MIRDGEFREDLYCRLAVLTVETTPLRKRRADIPAMIALFMREAASAVVRPRNKRDMYRIEEGALALLCEFDHPGNIRALRNLVYELTSYLDDGDTISIELVQFALARLNSRRGNVVAGDHSTVSPDFVHSLTSACNVRNSDLAEQQSFLGSIAREGDIILPLDLCVLRRGETFKQWTARAKRCSIEAARQATGGTMRTVAERLGLSPCSLKSHLQRARAQSEALFDWQRESD
jgi:DNA-binding NtrC family response regulator